MAVDKLVDSTVLDGYFSDIADAIRDKNGESGTYTPAQMPQAITDIPSGGGIPQDFLDLLSGQASGEIEITLPEYTYATTIAFGDDSHYIKRNNYDVTGLTVKGVTTWGNSDFGAVGGGGGLFFMGNASKLQYIRLPVCENLNMTKYNLYVNAFQNLEEFTAPNLTGLYVNHRAFSGYNPTKLKQFICPKCGTPFPDSTFYNCNVLEIVDARPNYIYSGAFNSCSALTALVLRRTTVTTLQNASTTFTDTPIASGTGYIYVPRSLITSYEAATNWSTFAGQFRVLEDYTNDGTIDGDFVMPV